VLVIARLNEAAVNISARRNGLVRTNLMPWRRPSRMGTRSRSAASFCIGTRIRKIPMNERK
jgi:hypothetical protein